MKAFFFEKGIRKETLLPSKPQEVREFQFKKRAGWLLPFCCISKVCGVKVIFSNKVLIGS